jgi:hypothetical protein
MLEDIFDKIGREANEAIDIRRNLHYTLSHSKVEISKTDGYVVIARHVERDFCATSSNLVSALEVVATKLKEIYG